MAPSGLSGLLLRLRYAWAFRTLPWRLGPYWWRIGLKRPPEHVFHAFRRIHDLPEDTDA